MPDTITVAEALSLGSGLTHQQTTTETYVIDGYLTAMVNGGDGGYAQYNNQIFWMADSKDGGSDNLTAFQVYQGIADVELFVGDKVRVITKIKRYNDIIESETKVPVELLLRDATTQVGDIQENSNVPTKVLKNNTIYIIEGEQTYDVLGRIVQ